MKAIILALAILASAVGVSWGIDQQQAPQKPTQAAEPPQPRGADWNVPDVARHEVERRGAMVEVVDQNFYDDGNNTVREAMAPPASDAHKFILNLIVSPDKSCAPCELLKKHLDTAPELAKWVKIEKVKQADGSEHWQSADDSFLHVTFEYPQPPARPERFKNVKITTVPTLILKPSLNGQWGDPSKVIRQLNGYNGKPAELDAWLTRVIREHAKQFAPSFQDIGVNAFATATGYTQRNPYGPNPFPVGPNGPVPFVVPVQPAGPLPIDDQPVPPPATPATPSTQWSTVAIVIATLCTAFGVPTLVVLLGFGAWGMYRTFIKSQGKTPLVPDAVVAQLKQEILDAMKKDKS